VDRDELLARVLSLADEGDWDAAAEILRERLSEFDDDPAVHCWLGVAEGELGLEGVAYERFKRALALDPVDPYVLATAGNGLAAFDDPDAERALRTAALTAPDVPLGRLLYGAYLAREGYLDDALVELRAARDLDEEDPQVAYELGAALALAGRYDEAGDALGDAVRLAPEDGWVRTVYGLVLLETERAEEAAGELAAGARLSEEDVDAQLAAALAAGAIGSDAVAYEMLERGRLRAVEGDLSLVTAAEDRLEAGPQAAADMLGDELAPDMLRTRLRQRP
jgi:Flp pilus assembly protein TadD